MNRQKSDEKSLLFGARAEAVLHKSGIAEVCRSFGCRVNIVGSLRMGLMAVHRDVDLHIYSRDVTTGNSFAIMAVVAENPRVVEVKCINGLHTDEHCIAWHICYKDDEGELWQFDVIHIEEGSRYDGYFENMADRIVAVMTPEQKSTILRLKFDTPPGKDYHGVEYYEAVIADNVESMEQFDRWVVEHRKKDSYYWVP